MNNDLISRAALQKSMDDVVFENVPVEHQPYVQVACDVFAALASAAPAVDAEPVRHGRWIQNKSVPAYHGCSYCHAAHKMLKSCNIYVLLNYCPNCGAKMRGDNDAAE